MPHRKRKTRYLRGSRTMGWGQVGQHRKSGMKGGRGKAGMHKHKWSYTIKYAPEHFGKHGFKSLLKPMREVNVDELKKFISKGLYELGENGVPIINLSKLGYGKLLGKGNITVKLNVVVEKASRKAAEKIRELGGKVILES